MSDLHETRVLAGYKATLHNSATSEDAKAHAEDVLREAGVDLDELAPVASSSKKHTSGGTQIKHEAGDDEADDDVDMVSGGGGSPTKHKSVDEMTPAEREEHTKHVLAGYKATLHNDRTSEKAKEHAREKIAEIEHEHEVHRHHVIGGFKATLHNARTSTEAKAHARAMLKEMDVDPDTF